MDAQFLVSIVNIDRVHLIVEVVSNIPFTHSQPVTVTGTLRFEQHHLMTRANQDRRNLHSLFNARSTYTRHLPSHSSADLQWYPCDLNH